MLFRSHQQHVNELISTYFLFLTYSHFICNRRTTLFSDLYLQRYSNRRKLKFYFTHVMIDRVPFEDITKQAHDDKWDSCCFESHCSLFVVLIPVSPSSSNPTPRLMHRPHISINKKYLFLPFLHFFHLFSLFLTFFSFYKLCPQLI